MAFFVSVVDAAYFSLKGILLLWRQSFLNVVDKVVGQVGGLI
ncbi:MAG: hypothetical protein ABH864_02765 [archaeon]